MSSKIYEQAMKKLKGSTIPLEYLVQLASENSSNISSFILTNEANNLNNVKQTTDREKFANAKKLKSTSVLPSFTVLHNLTNSCTTTQAHEQFKDDCPHASITSREGNHNT